MSKTYLPVLGTTEIKRPKKLIPNPIFDKYKKLNFINN